MNYPFKWMVQSCTGGDCNVRETCFRHYQYNTEPRSVEGAMEPLNPCPRFIPVIERSEDLENAPNSQTRDT